MLHAAFQLVKHRVSPIDLVAVDTCSGRRLYSFLSVAWGIIADVDSESERFRSLGNARFTVGAVVRIIGRHASRLRCSETELVTVHVGSLKMTDVKLQDVKLTDHIAGRKIVRREIAGHEIDGNEIVGHENAGHEIARHCFVRSISRAALQMRQLEQRFQRTH